MKRVMGLLAAVALVGGAAWANDSTQTDASTSTQSSATTGTSGDSASLPEEQGQSGVGGSGQEGAADQSGVILDEQPGTGGSGQANVPPPSSSGQLPADAQALEAGGEVTGKIVKVAGRNLWVDHMGVVVPVKITSKTTFDDPSLKSAKDLKQGDEIRASITVWKTQNIAQSLSLSTSATGGSGDQSSFGSDAGKGGSGSEQPPKSDSSKQPQDSPSDSPDESKSGTGY